MMRAIAATVALLAVLAFPARLGAHEGHAHKVMGTVKAVHARHVEIETKDGEKVSVSVSMTQETKYLRGKTPAMESDVKVGDRVVVTLMEKEGRRTAQEVLLAPSGGETSSAKPEQKKP